MKLVYICSPLKGDIKGNIEKAISYCAYAANIGVLPLAPHTIFTQYLDDTVPAQRGRGLEMGIELLKRCDELWVCGDTLSKGMENEIAFARQHGIKARYIPESEIMRDKDGIHVKPYSLSGKLSAAKRETEKTVYHKNLKRQFER